MAPNAPVRAQCQSMHSVPYLAPVVCPPTQLYTKSRRTLAFSSNAMHGRRIATCGGSAKRMLAGLHCFKQLLQPWHKLRTLLLHALGACCARLSVEQQHDA